MDEWKNGRTNGSTDQKHNAHKWDIKKTRGSKEPVSLTLVYVNIKQWTQMDS